MIYKRAKPATGTGVVKGLFNSNNPDKDNPFLTKKDLVSIKPYKIYTAILSQTNTTAPIATVLENTIGNIVWSYGGTGNYYATLSGAFKVNKTWFITGNEADCSTATYINSINQVQITTYSNIGVPANDMMFNLSIEIRVYE